MSLVSRCQTAFSHFSLCGRERGSGNIVSAEWCSDTLALRSTIFMDRQHQAILTMLPDPLSRPHKEKREKAVWQRESTMSLLNFDACTN